MTNDFGATNPQSNQNPALLPMQLMQQAWMMQMQVMQGMCMMPLYMMQGMTAMMGQRAGNESASQGNGFKLGNMEIPPELLGMLLNISMSPEDLQKLQKLLDLVFGIMPQPKSSTN